MKRDKLFSCCVLVKKEVGEQTYVFKELLFKKKLELLKGIQHIANDSLRYLESEIGRIST